MARVVTVYNTARRIADIGDMSYIRWFKISEELAALGHHVDMATAEYKWRLRRPVVPMGPRLRRVPLSSVRWGQYDVVKVLFHQGFETLRRYGGSEHPFLITKLGSVVADEDRDGILFYGRIRERLFRTQRAVAAASRYVTVLTDPAEALWREMHDKPAEILLVPGAAPTDIPPPGPDPFPAQEGLRCIFAGNIYNRATQPEANRVLVRKLNELGRLLGERGGRLYLLGSGRVTDLDPQYVHHLGSVSFEESWSYLHHADVGVLLSAGIFMHNNESTKIYHYLRAGLPMVSETGFPNDGVVLASGHGTVVPTDDLEAMADAAVAGPGGDPDEARDFILREHTWSARAQTYHELLVRHFGPVTPPMRPDGP
ncbi:MAG: glycosyltransferase [Gemmatimonadota bacterium]